ncbi:HAD-IIA family hydrolase [Cupriavidus oxalaticus]|uniref:HAD-IIA family hydrolase n=1 Tax=Cupriavidus oxalaticus TaxID=96344 RepID=UPI00316E15B4
MTAPTQADMSEPAMAAGTMAATWLDTHRHFLIDLDGTLMREGVPLPGAARMLECLHGRHVVVSNNSADTAQTLALRLHAAGMPVAADSIVLAGQATVDLVARLHAGKRILMIGSAVLRAYAAARGCVLVEEGAEVVLLALDQDFRYATLRAAVNALRRGAPLIVSNPDTSHPAADGGLVPETGTLMHAIVQCAGVAPALVVGKPEPELFMEGLRRLGARAADTLVIGDNPLTDALGAARLGMDYLLVGAHPRADAATPEALMQLRHPGHARVAAPTCGRADAFSIA